jgi:hypothetical protein
MSEEKLNEFEMQLIDNIIAQFKISDEKQVDEVSENVSEDVSKITYNDYYKNEGINYIKRNIKYNKSFLDPVFKAMAQNIKTPLEEWEERFSDKNEKKKVEVYESNYYY